MKIKLLSIALLLVSFSVCSGQQNNTWDKWEWLTGEWKGEGSGQPGQGEGTFSFSYDLDKRILVRRSHSEYPSAENKPGIVHDDLMIVYQKNDGNPDKAVYFDNEGHTIFYNIEFTEKSIILTSEKLPDSPVFRLIYIFLDNETVDTKFEMSQDGQKFMTYIEGKSKRVARP